MIYMQPRYYLSLFHNLNNFSIGFKKVYFPKKFELIKKNTGSRRYFYGNEIYEISIKNENITNFADDKLYNNFLIKKIKYENTL